MTDPTHLHILIAHDGTSGSDGAVQWAARSFPDATATILHVSKSLVDWGIAPRIRMPDQEQFDGWVLEAAQARLDAAIQVARSAGLEVDGVLRTTARNASRTVLDVAEELDPDLVVVGKHGPGRLGTVRLGSVAQALTSHSRAPIAVVPPSAETVPVDVAAPIVVGFDGSDGAVSALAVVARLYPGSRVVVASGWEPSPSWILGPPPSGRGWAEQFDERALEVATGHAQAGVEQSQALGLDAEPEILACDDGVAAALEALAAARGARAICLGARAAARLQVLALGSVAHSVVADAPLPVLLAHPASD